MGVSQLCGETTSSSSPKSNGTRECQRKKLARKCVFQVARMCASVCVCVCMHSTNEAVCGAIGFSLNTQRPRELPRAERTASVCVLVPSKQANLENTKGAANKHNLIPLSSYTWL